MIRWGYWGRWGRLGHLLTACGLALTVAMAHAEATPVGLWKAVNDDAGKQEALIRIVETNGVLTGRIERVLDPPLEPGAVCLPCEGDRKGQPILGLVIIEGVHHDADQPDRWSGGTILDPVNGKIYKARLTLQDDGRTMAVLGYIGAPFFGRTQTWLRVQ